MMMKKVTLEDEKNMINLFNKINLFNEEEVSVVTELLQIYLYQKDQKDYEFYAIETNDLKLTSFICYGPTPMTRGTYDLYWVGVHKDFEKQGLAKKLIYFMFEKVKENNGHLIRVETSGKESYSGTEKFYQKLDFDKEFIMKDFYDIGDDLVIYTKRF